MVEPSTAAGGRVGRSVAGTRCVACGRFWRPASALDLANRPASTAAADPVFGGIAPEATIYNYKVLATTPIGNGDDFSGALAIQQA